jgi:hypothetical protein
VNVVRLLTTLAKTPRAIALIGQLIAGWYLIDCECDLRDHSVVYMPATKKSIKKTTKVAFLGVVLNHLAVSRLTVVTTLLYCFSV